MPCMFCGTDTDLTIEHVFPAFMGGELEVPVGSCSRHNGEIAVWEGKIKKDTALLLHLLQVENRYGIVPNAKVDVAIPGVQMSGLQGIREPSGTIKLFDKVREITREDGTKLRSGFFVSNKSAEKFLAKAKERGEKIAERPAEEDITIDSSFLFTMAFCETPQTRRVVAKIASDMHNPPSLTGSGTSASILRCLHPPCHISAIKRSWARSAARYTSTA